MTSTEANKIKGFRPDPAIAFFDALAANTTETHIMALPKVPNTKGKYLRQYVDTSGMVKIGYGYGPGAFHFVVYRVTPQGVMRYFFEVDTKNFKNTNSRNHYINEAKNINDLGSVYKNILAYRKFLKWSGKAEDIGILMRFKSNLEYLCEEKKDTTFMLRQVATVILGKPVKKFNITNIGDRRIETAQKYLSQLRMVLSDIDYSHGNIE